MVRERCTINLTALQIMGRIRLWDNEQWVMKQPPEAPESPRDKHICDLLKQLAYTVIGRSQVSQHQQGADLEHHREIKGTCGALLIHIIDWIKEIGDDTIPAVEVEESGAR